MTMYPHPQMHHRGTYGTASAPEPNRSIFDLDNSSSRGGRSSSYHHTADSLISTSSTTTAAYGGCGVADAPVGPEVEGRMSPSSPQHSASGLEIVPHHNDILMGRGGNNNKHSGNQKLREAAAEHYQNYMVSTKKGKSYISRQLVQQMRQLDPPARFLKRNSQTAEWEDVGDDIAREKASQVLRDAVAANEETLSKPHQHGSNDEYAGNLKLPPASFDPPRSFNQPQYQEAMPSPCLSSVQSSIQTTPVAPSRKRPRHASQPTSFGFNGGLHASAQHAQQQQQQQDSGHVRRHSTDDASVPFRPNSYLPPQRAPSVPQRSASAVSHDRTSGSVHNNRGAHVGQLNEFDLFNGELLESDSEVEDFTPRGPASFGGSGSFS